MVLENEPNENSLQHGSGEVWVKGGKVFVRNPSGTGRVPTITPCPGIVLFFNGNKVEEKTAVREEDEIIIKLQAVEEPGSYKIRIAPGGLSAVLELKVGSVSRYVVQDHEPESDLVLKVVNLVEKSCPFNLAEIMQEMTGKNINFGIKHGEIQALFSKPESGLYLRGSLLGTPLMSAWS